MLLYNLFFITDSLLVMFFRKVKWDSAERGNNYTGDEYVSVRYIFRWSIKFCEKWLTCVFDYNVTCYGTKNHREHCVENRPYSLKLTFTSFRMQLLWPGFCCLHYAKRKQCLWYFEYIFKIEQWGNASFKSQLDIFCHIFSFAKRKDKYWHVAWANK